MRIISRKTLRLFWEKHRRAEKALRAWYHEAKIAEWSSYTEIKAQYPSADVRPNNRVIFNIKGNSYRLIVKIHYNTSVLYIRFVGAHEEYDHIDPDTI